MADGSIAALGLPRRFMDDPVLLALAESGDIKRLRIELHACLTDLATDFDYLGHRAEQGGNDAIEDDCKKIRELAASLSCEREG